MPFDPCAADETKKPVQRLPKLDEDDILDRLEKLQDALELPPDVWAVVLELLCPDSVETPPLPPGPTGTLPGTNARLRVMAERAAGGYQIFHPDDATWDDDEAERLGIAGCRLRNGATARMDAPLVARTHDGLRRVDSARTAAPGAGGVAEGFLLPAECTVVVGRLPPPPRRRRRRQDGPPVARQRLLWEDAETA